jgi:hypothetical protein
MLIFVRKNEWGKRNYQIRDFIDFRDGKIVCWNKYHTKVNYFDLWKEFDGENWSVEPWQDSEENEIKNYEYKGKK